MDTGFALSAAWIGDALLLLRAPELDWNVIADEVLSVGDAFRLLKVLPLTPVDLMATTGTGAFVLPFSDVCAKMIV